MSAPFRVNHRHSSPSGLQSSGSPKAAIKISLTASKEPQKVRSSDAPMTKKSSADAFPGSNTSASISPPSNFARNAFTFARPYNDLSNTAIPASRSRRSFSCTEPVNSIAGFVKTKLFNILPLPFTRPTGRTNFPMHFIIRAAIAAKHTALAKIRQTDRAAFE